MEPLFALALAPFAPPDSEVQRIAADLRINDMKNSGELRQREIDRALADQIKWGEQ
jgi:hypothetical protein